MLSTPPSTDRLRLVGWAVPLMIVAQLSIALFVFTVVGMGTVVVWVGIPIMLGAIALTRRFADVHRRFVSTRLGIEIPRPYLPLPEHNLLRRIWALVRDPATWRDLAWVLVNATAGFALLVLFVALFAYGPYGLIYPVLYHAIPGFPYFLGIPVDNVVWATLFPPAFGLAAFLIWWRYGPALLRGYGLLARSLLAPTAASRLAGRVRELADSRADTVDAQAAELRRIERDLHDGAQARLVALGMNIGMADQLLADDPQAARKLLAEARQASSQALSELRDVVRGIHPPVLADRGLDGAVHALALSAVLPVEVTVDIPGRLAAPVESAVYFAVAESLTNVAKHSGAAAVWVELRHSDGRLTVSVRDDGHGGADPARGTGLAGIERRLAAFDGTLFVTSPVGGPTILIMELPCELSSAKTSPSSGTG